MFSSTHVSEVTGVTTTLQTGAQAGATALHLATQRDDTMTCLLLIRAGAAVNASDSVRYAVGWLGMLDVVVSCYCHAPIPPSPVGCCAMCLMVFVQASETALHMAARQDNERLVAALLEAGANLHATNTVSSYYVALCGLPTPCITPVCGDRMAKPRSMWRRVPHAAFCRPRCSLGSLRV